MAIEINKRRNCFVPLEESVLELVNSLIEKGRLKIDSNKLTLIGDGEYSTLYKSSYQNVRECCKAIEIFLSTYHD